MVKHGRRRGVQRYRCTECGKQFQSQRRTDRFQKRLWHIYVWKRQTLGQLAQDYHRSIPWVQRQLDAVTVVPTLAIAQSIVAVSDTTFFGRGYGILAVRCPRLRRNLYWKEVVSETPQGYTQARERLQKEGFTLEAAVIDGKPGLFKVFSDIPTQMCHFHQIMIVRRYLTLRPKTEAGKELRRLSLTLPLIDEQIFTQALHEWHAHWESFLKERTVSEDGKHWQYTHRRIRSAYRSLRVHLPYLFTYQRHPQLKIPNTTNSLDGYFNRIKSLLNVHRGMTRQRRYKMIQEIMSGQISEMKPPNC